MIIEDPYKTKFDTLQPWIHDIFQIVRKDLKNEHLLKTPSFMQKHFPKRAVDKLTLDELVGAYVKDISEGDEELGEKVVSRWVLKNGEIFQFFAAELSKINPKYDEIESLSNEISSRLLSAAIAQFGVTATYLFCVLNSVVVSSEQLLRLREMAIAEKVELKSVGEKSAFLSMDALKEHYEKEMRKLTEKLEKRVQGIERKYVQDVEGLRRQIAQLHKKLGEKSG